MARNIKGITVEIGVDTTKLNKALQSVNSEIKNTQESMGTGHFDSSKTSQNDLSPSTHLNF